MKDNKSMIDWVKEYVSYRRNLGYRLQVDESELIRFARYVDDIKPGGPFTTELSLSWVLPAKSANYQHRRFEMVRSFAKYLSIYDPKTEIPYRATLRLKCYRPTPYIYSDQQITDLLKACGKLKGTFRAQTYTTLFGLLAATGLRVSEALKLNREDADLERGMLLIRDTKFRKSRLIPIDASTKQALCFYAMVRDRFHLFPKSERFFLSESGYSLPYSTVRGAFRQLRKRLGWEYNHAGKSPRIHDLRHTFACQRLLRWYDEGANVDHCIPFLSAFLRMPRNLLE